MYNYLLYFICLNLPHNYLKILIFNIPLYIFNSLGLKRKLFFLELNSSLILHFQDISGFRISGNFRITEYHMTFREIAKSKVPVQNSFSRSILFKISILAFISILLFDLAFEH